MWVKSEPFCFVRADPTDGLLGRGEGVALDVAAGALLTTRDGLGVITEWRTAPKVTTDTIISKMCFMNAIIG